jgi:hypothetical protein
MSADRYLQGLPCPLLISSARESPATADLADVIERWDWSWVDRRAGCRDRTGIAALRDDAGGIDRAEAEFPMLVGSIGSTAQACTIEALRSRFGFTRAR